MLGSLFYPISDNLQQEILRYTINWHYFHVSCFNQLCHSCNNIAMKNWLEYKRHGLSSFDQPSIHNISISSAYGGSCVVKNTPATAHHHTQQLVKAYPSQSTHPHTDALASCAAIHRLRLVSALWQDETITYACYAYWNKFLGTLYFDCTFFVFVTVVNNEPGLAT